MITLANSTPEISKSFAGLDASKDVTISEKACSLITSPVHSINQRGQLKNPDAKLSFAESADSLLLQSYASAPRGIVSGDRDYWVRGFWELDALEEGWRSLQSAPNATTPFGARETVINWRTDGEGMLRAGIGNISLGKSGVAVSQVGKLPCTLYTGELYDNSTFAITPKDPVHLSAIWAFCASSFYHESVRHYNQKLSVDPSHLVQVPFDLDHWQRVAAEKFPDGLPKPFSSDPTQWLFNGHPAGADHPLHVAVARLVGYLWPRQTGSSFPDCPALGPDDLETLADEDGIVCLASVRGEASAVERLRKLLASALGDEWSTTKERELLLATAVDNNAKKPEPDLESWLRNSFFSEHCKLFHSRPFIWQIWDGHVNGFSALVNYHKLAAPNGQGRKTLDQLTFTYLGDWIDRQKDDQAEGINGADDRLAAALDLQGQLKKILEGEPPYDLFVRWKPLHQQAIGWDPDINDGVRLNIRPFLSAQLRKGGKTGAGILRAKPGTIKWAKDRGKEPMRSKDEFPWFWGWDENSPAMATDFGAQIPGAPSAGDSFDGNRWNDLHYSRAAKEAARARHTGGES
jgi:hypothetical protein